MDLQDLHVQLLDILLELDRICRKHNIKYSLSFGTLLGAIRHHGFIPWDDDVDVMMSRMEYEKFCAVCATELNKRFFLQDKHTEREYVYNKARLRKNNTAMIYNAWKESGIHQGIYIDVDPVDNIADGTIARYIQYFFIIMNTPVRIAQNSVIFGNGGQKFNGMAKKLIGMFAKIMPVKLCGQIEDYFIQKYNIKDCKKCGIICEGGLLINTPKDMLPFDSRIMNEYIDIEFEGKMLMCVKETDAILTHWYGDYMQLPPKEDRVMTHHPIVFDTENDYTNYIGENR